VAFTHTTFASLKDALALRLSDSGNVYWSDDELGEMIKEALQTWGLLTGYWRERGQFTSTEDVAFYELSTMTNTDAEVLLPRTQTDSSLVKVMQYHLLEPATGISWTGSDQFTLSDMTEALQRRRDQLLLETGCVLTRSTAFNAANEGVVELADTTMDVRRLVWTGGLTGTTWPVYRDDPSRQHNYSLDDLNTPGVPSTFSTLGDAELSLQLVPAPSQPGTLDMLTLRTGASLNPAAGVALGIPNDMAWIIKWGALADVLGKEGPARDLGRSYFCERRWRMGVELARLSPVTLDVSLNGVPVSTDSLSNLDKFMPNWQSTSGTVDTAVPINNYLVLAPKPSDEYLVTVTVVRAAILPSLDTDYVQIGREYLNVILDYAEHLASFKMGGMEFRTTFKAAENFLTAAIRYNERMAASNPNAINILRQSLKDLEDSPRRATADPGMVKAIVNNVGQIQ
jgi:hypothetical protein